MIRFTRRRVVAVLSAGAVGLLLALALRRAPTPVDVVAVARGPLRVTLDEEACTRVRDRFVVVAPVAGRVERIVLDPGAVVDRGTVLARLRPMPLDPRTREQAEARVRSAEDARSAAVAAVEQTRAALVQARRERERATELAGAGLVAAEERERLELAEARLSRELEAADFRAQASAHEVAAARAALSGGVVVLRSPVRGRVLAVPEKSERVVAAATRLIEVGDPTRLEIVADLLSADAVQVPAGAPVLIEQWGGEGVLRGRVRLVEPAGFTKVSALGVEEQRVNVVIDFLDPPQGLGDAYRVEVRIVVWEGEGVLKAPASALFRRGDGWAVFVVEQERAQVRAVRVGHRNAVEAEILEGLAEGARVVAHPSDRLAAGVRVTPAPVN